MVQCTYAFIVIMVARHLGMVLVRVRFPLEDRRVYDLCTTRGRATSPSCTNIECTAVMPKGPVLKAGTCARPEMGCVNGCSITATCGCSSKVEYLLAMQVVGVRFPVSALLLTETYLSPKGNNEQPRRIYWSMS